MGKSYSRMHRSNQDVYDGWHHLGPDEYIKRYSEDFRFYRISDMHYTVDCPKNYGVPFVVTLASNNVNPLDVMRPNELRYYIWYYLQKHYSVLECKLKDDFEITQISYDEWVKEQKKVYPFNHYDFDPMW